ncbi:hypothetical protein [Massilia sp. ST3]|uniref:hypothetical protein n=1 Tax=Massilia sp. ST3 TaxID=2824903 RepID=UPI001B845AC9|nr:hypothetical protein [Massilia sp. ST3]MBQ5947089.1 hypothetical protein [Massilia sp. ST3]
MNTLKHMEAVFIVTAAMAVSASYLGGAIPEAQARPYGANPDAIATSGKVAVVTVTAKRLSLAEKAAPMLASR